MKNIIKISIVVLVISSCDLLTQQIISPINDVYFLHTQIKEGFDLIEVQDEFLETWSFNPSTFKYILSSWICTTVVPTPEEKDYWQSPRETLDRCTGDCEDLAILFLNIYYQYTQIKGNLVLVHTDRAVTDGGKINHAVVEIDGVVFDPQNPSAIYTYIGYTYTFDTLFK